MSHRFGVYESKTKPKVIEGGKKAAQVGGKPKSKGQGLAVLIKCLPGVHRAPGSIPSSHRLSVTSQHICKPNTRLNYETPSQKETK